MIDSATLTIWGNVVADPRVTGLADNPDRVAFRIISNRRRRDPQTGEWVQASELGMNVVCWRKLARGVAQSVHKGDPVLVIGRVSDRHFTGNDGQPRWLTELTADFVGPDLSQGISGRFTRFTQLDRMAIRGDDGSLLGDGEPPRIDELADDDTGGADFAEADAASESDFSAADVLDAEPVPAVF